MKALGLSDAPRQRAHVKMQVTSPMFQCRYGKLRDAGGGVEGHVQEQHVMQPASRVAKDVQTVGLSILQAFCLTESEVILLSYISILGQGWVIEGCRRWY